MTSTREPFTKPIFLEGTGDALLDINIPGGSPGVAHIRGNAAGRYFSIRTFDNTGNPKPLVTIARVPYDGLRPLDFYRDETTLQIEVSAIGEWSIELLPLSYLERLHVPGKIQGTGDSVFIVVGENPDQIMISNDPDDKYFDVITYGKRRTALVSTASPNDRSFEIDGDAKLIEIQAVGAWEVEISAK